MYILYSVGDVESTTFVGPWLFLLPIFLPVALQSSRIHGQASGTGCNSCPSVSLAKHRGCTVCSAIKVATKFRRVLHRQGAEICFVAYGCYRCFDSCASRSPYAVRIISFSTELKMTTGSKKKNAQELGLREVSMHPIDIRYVTQSSRQVYKVTCVKF